MLDDIQLFYYDSDVGKLMDRRSKTTQEEQQDAKHVFGYQHQQMKEEAFFFRQRLNSTDSMFVTFQYSIYLH